jgi:orotate phosphoribosyltransferase
MATMLARSPASTGGGYSPSPSSDTDWRTLCSLLATRTFKRGEFTLASGKRSRMYFNMKATMMHPQGASLCARLLLARIAALKPDYMGGLEMGAVPLLGTVAAYSADRGKPIPAIFVRKQAKAHGTALMIEGLDDTNGETLTGKTVILVDDVATSGGSVLKAIDEIAAAGGKVTDAIVILDREQGATEFLRDHGVTLHALFTATDLGVTDADRAPLA